MVQAHVALALLLRVVKGMRVQERPDKLPADVFQAKFKMRVLVNRMVTTEKSGRANLQPLLVGDFLRADNPRRVTGPRGGDGRIVRVRKVISEGDARCGSFELHTVRLRRSHRLGSHCMQPTRAARIDYGLAKRWKRNAEPMEIMSRGILHRRATSE